MKRSRRARNTSAATRDLVLLLVTMAAMAFLIHFYGAPR